MLLFRADPFGGTHELLPCGLLGGDLVELFRKDKSKYYWYDFTARGERYRGSTKETNETRAQKAAALKLAATIKGSLPYLLLFTLRDIFSDSFRRALHRPGGYFQPGQDFHLFAAMIEGSILANQGVHAAHTGRELGVLDVQFHVGRKLASMAVRAQVVWARDLRMAHHRQHRLGT